ncbi:MAG: sigma-70 family RNA polymerase sigma factor [Oscillospiraceae bacterium]|nr:sigma-70 family RNA polymerase sigma factor [Oscillospiraceae bacterium]
MLDAEIIELYLSRDESAIEMSNRQYGAYCRRISMNILESFEDSEECVNDTWHKSWNSIPPQHPNSLAAYFGRIVRNLSISRFRQNRAKKRYDGVPMLLSELDGCLPATLSVEAEIESQALTDSLNNWLESLDAVDRVLFMRRYWFGDSVKALAKQYGISQNNAAQSLYRLRLALRKHLTKEGFHL